MFDMMCLFLIGCGTFMWLLRKLKVKDYSGRHVVITGCDTGFGNGLAKRLDNLGFNTFAACLTEKGASELKKMTSSRLVALQCDVTNDESIKRFLQSVQLHLPLDKGIWALVNNAGVTGAVAPSEWLCKEEWKIPMSVNVLGMAAITNHFLPLLRRARGRIINTSSVLGRVAVGSTPYTISKFCVEGYSDCLRRELYYQGVSVHIIEPGAFKTTITDPTVLSSSMERVYRKCDLEVQEYYGRNYCAGLRKLMDLLSNWGADGDLDKVVDAYTHAVTSRFPKTRYVVGLDANILYRFFWTVPDWVTDFVFGLVYPTPQGCQGR